MDFGPSFGGTSFGEPSFGGPSFGGSSFGAMTSAFPIIFFIIFAIVIGGIVLGIVNYTRNATSPQQTVFARIVSKRLDVRHHTSAHDQAGHGHISSSSRTYYYITLEFDNGERKEFLDVKHLYGLVAEGDSGYAATKGDWIVAFERSRNRADQT